MPTDDFTNNPDEVRLPDEEMEEIRKQLQSTVKKKEALFRPDHGIHSPLYKLPPKDNSKVTVDFQKVLPNARIPEKKSAGAAAYDLYSAESVEILPFVPIAVSTGLCVSIPEGFKGEIYSRSGMALNENLFVMNQPGKIDSDYRGELKVILFYAPRDMHTALKHVINGIKNFARKLKPVGNVMEEACRELGRSMPVLTKRRTITAGERIAQFEVQQTHVVLWNEVNELGDTERGSGGFGSTG